MFRQGLTFSASLIGTRKNISLTRCFIEKRQHYFRLKFPHILVISQP